ncbi:MAG: PilZ domain-containing protein [Magnetococcales bacterium]|nr:PilZ domain-containing protein [Magnetococcales bacterium]
MGLAEEHSRQPTLELPPDRRPVDQRKRPRFLHRARFLLQAENEAWLPCVSRDVSASGLFLHIEAPPRGLARGDRIFLSMPLNPQGALSFHCKVAYVGPDGMGLDAEENQGALGHAITLSLFNNISSRYANAKH